MRANGTTFAEFSRRFAAWLDMHYTDATALLEITAAEQRGDPLSPARLSERVSLSSGATTMLIDRLERAHHVVRTRKHSDRTTMELHLHEQDSGRVGATRRRSRAPRPAAATQEPSR